MKLLKPLSLLMLALAISPTLNAQNVVQIYPDSLGFLFNSTPCPTPVAGNITVYGGATNYNSVLDSITIQVFWGDGSVSLDTVELQESGTLDYFNSNPLNHSYTLAGTYIITVIATAPNGVADTAYGHDSITVYSSCVTIDGYTYEDLNANCTLEATDDTVTWQAIRAYDPSSNSYVATTYSDSSGYYSMQVPSGINGIVLKPFSTRTTTCPSSGSVTFNSNSNQSFNFGSECQSSNYDFRVNGWARLAPPGDTGIVFIRSRASSCDTFAPTQQDTAILVLDSNVTFIGISQGIAPSVLAGDTLIWYYTYTNYGYGANNFPGIWANIEVQTDTTVSLGDTGCFYSKIGQPSNDLHLDNNSMGYCAEYSVAYDPNNKIAMQGSGPEGIIDTNVSQLGYVVNFQNTGTAPARDVYILDTLPKELISASLSIMETSDEMTFKIIQDSIIRFNFDNIYLPDSMSDPEGSKGYVMFELQMVDGLEPGTKIKNSASIYFDYNPPIHTNTAVNKIYADPIPLNVQLFARNVTCINSDNGRLEAVVTSGNPPYTYQWSNGSQNPFIESLSAGTYTVTVKDAEGLVDVSEYMIVEDRTISDPEVAEVNGPTSVQAWEPYIYSMTNVTGNFFEWDVVGGELVDQANNQAEILWYGGPEGTILVTQIDEHGCFASKETMIPILFVGQEEVSVNGLELFPNPVEGQLFIRGIDGYSSVNLTIYDNIGRLVHQQAILSSNAEINVGHLSGGTYIVHVHENGESIGNALIVKN